MKTRFDFVSNSSSSSFIIAKTEIFKHFKISKEIIKEAIADLWIGDEIDEIDTNDMNKPYVVYEMPRDRAIAVRAFGRLLSSWNQKFLCMDDVWDPDKEASEAYQNLLDSLSRADSSWYFFNGDDDDLENSNAPEHIKQTIKDARKKFDIKKADEVLLDDTTHLFIHFGNNDITNVKGMDVNSKDEKQYSNGTTSSEYETPSFSCERFIEILFKWLVEHNKIDPKDKEMLKLYPLDEYYKKNTPNTNKISWLKDDTYTWKDFIEEGVVHAMFHEG